MTRLYVIAPAFALACLTTTAALAGNAAEKETQRNANQQQRIEQGLQSGELTTREASKLERRETHIERTESRAMRDGTVSNAEQARIRAEQNRTSHAIHQQKHDGQEGDPNSASSRRMQADVQRNANQQQRINNGLDSGQLSNTEAARLEHGQARDTRIEANAGADGHVGAGEQARMRRNENHQSREVRRQRHD